jgi:hypothetical protein
MIWDLHCHPSGVSGRTLNESVVTLVARGVQVATIAVSLFGFVTLGGCQRPQSDLDAAIERVQGALVEGDKQTLQRLFTHDGWKQVNACYDFHLGALRFKGTFSDFLRECGEVMETSRPDDVETTVVSPNAVVFFFDRTLPEGWTIAVCKEDKEWLVAYLSPGNIDVQSIFKEAIVKGVDP